MSIHLGIHDEGGLHRNCRRSRRSKSRPRSYSEMPRLAQQVLAEPRQDHTDDAGARGRETSGSLRDHDKSPPVPVRDGNRDVVLDAENACAERGESQLVAVVAAERRPPQAMTCSDVPGQHRLDL